MSGVELSYLTAWAVVTGLLVAAGGVAVLFAPLAVVSGLHRAHVWRRISPALLTRRT